MGDYRCIVADPPWPDQGRVLGRSKEIDGVWVPGTRRESVPYPTMSVEEICDLPIAKQAMKDSFLFVWVLNMYLPRVYDVAIAWGFTPVTMLYWCKVPMGLGMGGTFTSNVEPFLFAKRGSPKPKRRVDSRWFTWPRGRHSQKPEASYDLIESVADGPYLELFARRVRLGWDAWGDEVSSDVQLTSGAEGA